MVVPQKKAQVYHEPDMNMMFRVIEGPVGPGLITLMALRAITQSSIDDLQKQILALAATDKTIQTTAASTQSNVASLSSSIAEINAKIATLNDTDALIKARLNTLEAMPQLQSEVITGVTTAVGVASVTFTRTYKSIPTILDHPVWVGDNVTYASPNVVTKTGATLYVKQSRGTLLLTAGPFGNAPVNSSFRVFVIGEKA